MANEHLTVSLKTGRIEALSDGIFAVAMTILIISFDILLSPQKGISEAGLITTLLKLWPDLLHYIEGFIILGAFWIEHHYQFHFIHPRSGPVLYLTVPFILIYYTISGTLHQATPANTTPGGG